MTISFTLKDQHCSSIRIQNVTSYKIGNHIQDKIMERIEEFYSELYDSDQAVTTQTDPKEVPPITAWEVEAALRKMKNGKEAGKDQVNIETLKAGDETIAKQLAKLYTKCITERRIPKTWKEANMVIFLFLLLFFSRKETEKISRTTDQFA